MDEEVEIILQQDSVEVTEPLVADYVLPTASSNTLGGVKIGDNISIDGTGHISVPVASESVAGVVKVGTGLSVDALGTLSTDISDLPQATKNSLGVVYVDDELNTLSQNPLQNAVVALKFQEVNGDISTLTGTTSGLSTTVGNLSTTVGNLSTTVGNLSANDTNQDNAISSLQGNVSSIADDIGDINDDIMGLSNGFADFQGTVAPTLVTDDIAVPYTDVDNQSWTSGSLDIYRRGKVGVLNVLLFGSKTLANGDSVILYTLTDDNVPTYETYGNLWTDAGLMNVTVSTSGNIVMQNLTGSSVTITKLIGSMPIVFV